MNFKQLVLMNLQALTNFPYIEKDFDAVTDYELLCLVVDHLNEVIKNSNEQNTVIQNLYNAFVALKDYVDNYFDNLDVQEEINNKLDDMAESGQLADIIAQYLRLAGVLAFNTLNDLKGADNIVNGSICLTLGRDIYNDGDVGYYKIRTITSSDIVDGYNIISLNISNTLIGERIKNLKESFNLNYYLGAFHKKYDEFDKRIYLFLSNDAVNFTKIPNIEISGNSSSGGGDPSIIYDKETKNFLIAYSNQDVDGDTKYCFTVMKSKDLINWTEYPITLNLPTNIQGYNKWAPDFFRDKNGDLFVIFSADKTPNGYDFVNFITKCTDVENLTFDTPYAITTSDTTSLYDNSIRYFKGKYYMIATNFDNSSAVGLKMYESTDRINFTLVNSNVTREYYKGTLAENAIEGCNLEIINDSLFIYAEMPNVERYFVAEYDTSSNSLKYIKMMNELQTYRHGSVMNITDINCQNVVNNVAKNIVNYDNIIPLLPRNLVITLTENTTIDKFTLHPNQLLVINANGYSLTINKIIDPFKLYKLQFIIYDDNGSLSIGGYEDDQYSSYSYTASLKGAGKKEKTVDFRFNALDNSYDFLQDDSGIQEVTLESGITGHIYYEKIGHVVSVLVDITGTYSYGLLLGNLPAGYRPKADTISSVCNRNYESNNNYIAYANNGSIAYIGNDTSGHIVGNITYLV